MASLLRSYGMAQKEIDTLKRWDRVHVIRDLSTKAASDGIGDGLERFARGEKMKLAEQKQMYRDRVQTIWGRQIAWLSSDAFDKTGVSGPDAGAPSTDGDVELAGTQGAQAKKVEIEKDSSDDSDADDDFAAALEDEMMDRAETNQLVAAHTGGSDSGALGQLRAVTQDLDLSKDARELAALKRQREEERAAQEGFQSLRPTDDRFASAPAVRRKVIKKVIRRTHPDGRQTTTFKFILHPEEVGRIMARKEADEESPRVSEMKLDYSYGVDEKPPGHAMFEDEDDFDYSSKGRMMSNRRRGPGNKKNRSAPGMRAPTVKPRSLQIGKLKTKISKEERMRKRKREEEELDVYVATAKRKGGANNRRRERGSIRDHRPHVKYAEKLEGIRATVEARSFSGPFHKPVNRKILPRYYEVISHPIDLSTIRDKISRYRSRLLFACWLRSLCLFRLDSYVFLLRRPFYPQIRYEYRTADAFVRDFELMKSNATKFNGPANLITQEAVAIYEFVRDQVESFRPELRELEEQVDELMNAKPKKKLKAASGTRPTGPGSSAALGGGTGTSGGSHLTANVAGHTVNLGSLGHLRNIALGHGADEESDDDSEASVEL
jgi:transcription initiation factor TFIID subunit 1